MELIDIVKSKLPTPYPDDAKLLVAIAEVAQSILNYCNRLDIPEELKYVHANMVVDFLNGNNRKAEPEGQTSVSSIKEGDVTVQFGLAKIASHERSTESILFDYAGQLNKFRKLRWSHGHSRSIV